MIIKKIRGKSSKIEQEKVLVISLHKLGDTIFTFPTIKYLRKHYGNNLNIVCFEESVLLYKKLDPELTIIELEQSDFVFEGRICKSNVRTKINKLKPTLIFDLNGTITSVSCLIKIIHCEIYSTTSKIFVDFYNNAKIYRKKPHLIDMYFDVVRLMFPDAIPDYNVRSSINYSNSDFILIHPFAGWKAKEWNFVKFIEIAKELSKDYPVKIIFEKGQVSNDVVDDLSELNFEIVITSSIGELLECIENCSIIIGNDSGPIYIGDFLGKPTFSIYGPTNPTFSIPFSNSSKYTSNVITCSPITLQYCFNLGGRFCPSYECMQNLEFQKVLDLVKLLLDELHLKKIN